MAAISFTSIFDIINIPLGFVLRFCYQLTSNYGLAIILFTVIIRVVLVPLAIKQQKSLANTVRLQPKLQALQKKYAKDKQKFSQEQMKLYQEEGASPMGGCLPLVVQLPIIYGLYNVIYHPLLYIAQLGKDVTNRVIYDLFTVLKVSYPSVFANMKTPSQALSNGQVEIYAAKLMPHHLDKLSFLPKNALMLDFNFFGLDLSTTPGYRFSIYLLIPILCYLSSFLQVWLSTRINKENNIAANAPGTGGMNIGMMLVMPLISAWISFTLPSGIGVYWIASNLIMMAQTILLNKFYNPKQLAEVYEQRSLQRKRERAAAMRAREERLAASLHEENETEKDLPEENEKPLPKSEEDFDPDQKYSNKKQMDENRRRLSVSREKEALEQKAAQVNPPRANQTGKKKKRRRR